MICNDTSLFFQKFISGYAPGSEAGFPSKPDNFSPSLIKLRCPVDVPLTRYVTGLRQELFGRGGKVTALMGRRGFNYSATGRNSRTTPPRRQLKTGKGSMKLHQWYQSNILWFNSIDYQVTTNLIFLDSSKGFDRVPRSRFIAKLSSLIADCLGTSYVWSFLSFRSQFTLHGEYQSP